MNRARVIVAVVFLLLAITGGTYAKSDKIPIRNLPSVPSDQILTQNPNAVPVRFQPQRNLTEGNRATDQHIGDVDTVGNTWYDNQHNGSCGRMIRVDSQGRPHVAWMNGLDNQGANRHVYYNVRNIQSGWAFGDSGTAVESTERGGYTTLAIDYEDNPYIAFHVITQPAGFTAHAAVATIPLSAGQFVFWECPYVYQGSNALEIIWPKIAIDRQNRIHLINTDNPFYTWRNRIYYCRGVYNPVTVEIEYTDQQFVEIVETISADIAASRISDRVAFVYSGLRTDVFSDTNQFNNDVRLVVSEDGLNWDFNDYLNVTDFIYPDTSLFPDTTAALGDTLRTYVDACVFFDDEDNIHIAFTTPYYDAIRRLISVNSSLIWHWCDATGFFSLVADGWFGDDIVEACGAWQRFVQRPCIAEDESTGDLFITYQQFDTSDVAENGYPQGEAYISRSTDNGVHWSVGTNVTNTHAPGAAAGACIHEREITCNMTVVSDTLHLFYILDKDAGSIANNEGGWTLNPAICQYIPIDQIPATPLMPRYPLHVDSTGLPPESPVFDLSRQDEIPENFQLHQNYPNPFNPTTTIAFDLDRPEMITLKVYNVLGREVGTLVDGHIQAGTYRVAFDGSDLASGVYFYRLTSATQTLTRKMVMLR